jgi:hypothetical protein
MLEVIFEQQGVERTEVFEWFLEFKSSAEDAEHLGCPLMSRTDEYVD